MSQEDVRRFLEMLKTDPVALDRFSQQSDWASKNAFIEQAGFSFSKEEMKTFTEELSDVDLDAVAGGGSCTSYCDGDACSSWGNCDCVSGVCNKAIF